MDYKEVPRSLIYKYRSDLNDFRVKTPGTINHQLFLNLKELFMATDRTNELIVRCFNNAYYICTILPFDDFPETLIDKYEKKLLEGESYAAEEICAVSMAMVCKLLPASDARWKQESCDLIENILYRFTHYQWWNSGVCSEFKKIAENNNTDGFLLSPIEFSPRDIVEAIENVDVGILMAGVEYVCERLALLDNPKSGMYGADLAIAHINDKLQLLYEDYGYNPKTNKFKQAVPGTFGAEPDFQESFWKEVNPFKKAIEYIESHRPTDKNDSGEHPVNAPQKPGTQIPVINTREMESIRTNYEERLKLANNNIGQQAAYIKKLESDVRNLKDDLQKAQDKIKEYMQPVEDLTANHKVRMAFALQLLRIAGLTDDILKNNKSKVAALIHLLTDIGANNNGSYPSMQICQNWLVYKKYYPSQNVKIITEINTLCAQLQLDTNAYLKLGE